MALEEGVLQAFMNNNGDLYDELIGTDASKLSNLLSNAALSGMEESEILEQVVTATTSRGEVRRLLNDGLNTYSRVSTNTMMKDAPKDTKYVYVGVLDEKTRDECVAMIAAGLLTEKEIVDQFGSIVLVDGGGYNCRHKWEVSSEYSKDQQQDARFELKKRKPTIKELKKTKETIDRFKTTEDAERFLDESYLEEVGEEEHEAIQDYTADEGSSLNKTLRAGGELGDDTIKEVKLINQAMDKLPTFEGTTYRGVPTFGNLTKSSKRVFEEFVDQFVEGDVVSRPAFSSTSTELAVAETFASESRDGYGVVFKIKSKNGKYIGSLSPHPTESEVLFRNDSVFKVVKKTLTKVKNSRGDMVDNMIIELEEI